MHVKQILLGALCTAGSALGHAEMMRPYALGSKYDIKNTPAEIDYSNTSPLNQNGSNFPCRGNHLNRAWRTVMTYKAGQTDYVTIGGIAHRGGSCQLFLSYDYGKTFRVIQSMMGACPLNPRQDFQIPSFAPSGKALFGFTWFNFEGAREMYMNCAMVEITDGPTDTTEFDKLPEIFKANIGNGCKTTEYKEVVFPNPGPKVVYGASQSTGAQVPVKPGDPPFPVC